MTPFNTTRAINEHNINTLTYIMRNSLSQFQEKQIYCRFYWYSCDLFLAKISYRLTRFLSLGLIGGSFMDDLWTWDAPLRPPKCFEGVSWWASCAWVPPSPPSSLPCCPLWLCLGCPLPAALAEKHPTWRGSSQEPPTPGKLKCEVLTLRSWSNFYI